VQLATVHALARYWATEYDWRKIEAKLNALPQFITEIEGLDICFIHVRSKHENLIVTREWPGSITEQMRTIDPLANPTAHGGKASDAFDVVVPSMPGYGSSGRPATTGGDPAHIARAWSVLMKRRGYTKFAAQGWRLACRHHRADGRPGVSGVAGHSHPHAERDSTRYRQADLLRRAGTGEPLGRREPRLRADQHRLCEGPSPTPTRWVCGPRRCYGIADSRSAWRRISSITTRAVTK
jgi:epoxide hydrolase-like protein